MESDIVERLRGVKHNSLADMTHEAADEIERLCDAFAAWKKEREMLRAELAAMKDQRDEARREACAFEAINRWNEAHPRGLISGCAVVRIAREIAVERGWDCFAQEGGGA